MIPVAQHPFLRRPQRTVLTLTLPVIFSQIAEPLTAMVDTAFVARLGAVPLAALGVGGAAVSLLLWIFYFLGVSVQTEVSRALGHGSETRASQISSLALLLAACSGLLLTLLGLTSVEALTQLLGAGPEVQAPAMAYIQIRLLGAPAVMLTLVGFGTLRGLQDMRTPLWIALGVNLLNALLDIPFIFGLGPLPAMGVAGAAWASIIAQYLGALWLLRRLQRRLDLQLHFARADLLLLLRAGRDLVVRSGLLTLFLLLSTRVANQIGPEAGAAHQAVRALWMFCGWLMDAFGTSAQSLVGYFLGAQRLRLARQAAAVAILQALATGILLGALALLAAPLVRALFVPPEAAAFFTTGWLVAALTLPLTALAFVTDGIHWGAGDYAWLRNGMIVATLVAALLLLLTDTAAPEAFLLVWLSLLLWLILRTLFGMLRIWPGHARAPLRHMRPPRPA